MLVFLVAVIHSCKGQEKKNSNSATQIEKESISLSSLKIEHEKNLDPEFMRGDILTPEQGPDGSILPVEYEGQLCHWVRNIFEDSSGNLWFGTNHFGIMRYDGKSLEYITDSLGMKTGRINSIVEDSDGNVWFSTYSGLIKFDGQSIDIYSVEIGPVKNDLWGMIIDKEGDFWIGSSDGAVRISGDKVSLITVPKSKVDSPKPVYSHNRVSTIMEDSSGRIWFGTDGYGITIFNKDSESFEFFTTDDGLCDNNVADLLEDSNGNIWIGTMMGGICKYDGQTFTNFTAEGTVEGSEAASLYKDSNGNIWFAAENHGVYQYNKQSGEFTNYYKNDGLKSGGILSILEDNSGRFWFGGFMGLFRYNGKSFVTVTKDGPWE